MACENVFWVNDIRQLVCDFSVIPMANDTLAVTMNKITRIAVVLSLAIMCWSVKSGVVVLVLSFIFILSMYYGMENAEKFTEDRRESVVVLPQFDPSTSSRFCNDCDALAPNDPDYTSRNQMLVGWGYPKTRIPPIVAPRSHDLESWSDSGLTRRNQINRKKPFDMYSSGYSCMFDDRSNERYRDQVMTQTLQPGVYQKSTVGEPINSMVGVSYQQQFLPTVVQQSADEIKFTQVPDYSNVYDPRFTGYGASDRVYIEPMTGQARFFYGDVDAVRMPNYITRSKVDSLPWAPTYGPDVPMHGYGDHRQLANNAYHDSALVFRTEMQERLMRKRNAEMWQRRVAPIYTNQQLGLGSTKSCM